MAAMECQTRAKRCYSRGPPICEIDRREQEGLSTIPTQSCQDRSFNFIEEAARRMAEGVGGNPHRDATSVACVIVLSVLRAGRIPSNGRGVKGVTCPRRLQHSPED